MNVRTTFEQDEIQNLDSRLTDSERQFRIMLLDRLIKAGQPLTVTELAGDDSPELKGKYGILTETLKNKGLLVLDDNGTIVGVYPVSAKPTGHRVHLADGPEFFAMCAIDALGCTFEFGIDAVVTSTCGFCKTPLSVTLEKGEIAVADPADIHVLHVDLDHYADWAVNC